MKRLLIVLSLLLVLLLVGAWLGLRSIGLGSYGEHEGPGQVTEQARPADAMAAVAGAQSRAAGAIGRPRAKQILFGDLHVHTTFSFDAFLISVPMTGEGSHPPADACDFARFCSALDFWSINDHAEAITPRHWSETVESIRHCNAVTAGAGDPDTVAFLGWEWTNVGLDRDSHYGHKNVVLRHLDDERIPARPISSRTPSSLIAQASQPPDPVVLGLGVVASGNPRMHDLARYFRERSEVSLCDTATPSPELPLDCLEGAATPADLYRKLDEWGHEAVVIPHGTTWGFYSPPGTDWAKQLAGPMHSERWQTLVEIYSGHGNSEEYRDYEAVHYEADGSASCPEPSDAYEPRCWRAGEIIRERCLALGEPAEECEARAVEARQLAAEAGQPMQLVVPGQRPADWGVAGQCQDCLLPAFNYRPRGSAQYMLALSNFDAPGDPRRFRFGFIASSDNHYARPGTGYKEKRAGFSESRSLPDDDQGGLLRTLAPEPGEPVARAQRFDLADAPRGFALVELERQGSFFQTGGLMATHASGRDRDSIWEAMDRREVYATSGPRMLLWFDLLNPPGATGPDGAPMGSEVEMAEAPIFQARAVGSFEQQPGCPDYAVNALGAERLDRLCRGECYHPSDRRRRITRIDVVRIRPQASPGEPIAPLIEDPWKSIACELDEAGCTVTFTDPEFPRLGRDTAYYVRAVEEPRLTVNAAAKQGVLCEARDDGEDCLAPEEPAAWSSPIYVDHRTPALAARAR